MLLVGNGDIKPEDSCLEEKMGKGSEDYSELGSPAGRVSDKESEGI